MPLMKFQFHEHDDIISMDCHLGSVHGVIIANKYDSGVIRTVITYDNGMMYHLNSLL